ncbi:MAG: alpha/beta hydrolase [Chloroflexi bacterium]|nr:alpha/beta hydrolase [Chloroflexota bacterium]
MPTVELAMHTWAPGADAPPRGTVVLVHGVTGWHRTWWRVGPALADAGWRVVAVDQRGHGHSPRIEGFTTVAELAGDLASTVEGLGAPVDAVVGHSLGAAVAAELAHERPELVRRVVLEDPPAVTRADDIGWQANLERELLAAEEDPASEIARELSENPGWAEEDARQDVDGKRLADRFGLVATFRRDTGARVLELAPTLRVPALYVLAAEGRSVLGGEHRRRLVERLPDDARVVVADAGHTVHRDCPNWYVSTVLEWIGS